MIQNFEIILIYSTGLFQGLALVVVPAASLIFTSPDQFGFSLSDYGFLFIPQVIAAIIMSVSGPAIVQRWGIKAAYRLGLFLNILAMAMIATSQMVLPSHQAAYLCIIFGTGFVGAAFGLTLPIINVYATQFFSNSAAALTALHTLLGIGTALAPLFVAILIKSMGWWTLPVFLTGILTLLLTVTFVLPLKDHRPPATKDDSREEFQVFLPFRVRLFMLTVFLYGYCETFFANWAIIFLNKEKGIPTQAAGYALAGFWMMVSLGRLLVSFLSVWVPPRLIYRFLPVLMMVSLLAVTYISSPLSGIFLFSLAGLSCSAFFPLTFSFGQKGFEAIAERVSGWLMAAYMLGYGFAAYGIGALVGVSHTTLSNWYLGSTLVGLGVAVLSFILT